MRTWTLEIDALDGSDAPETLRFSTHYYKASVPYQLRLTEPPIYQVAAAGGILGKASGGYGEAVLNNLDGALDYLADYAVDGRVCRITLISSDETFELSGEFDLLAVGGGDLLDVSGTGDNLIVSVNSVTAFLGVVQRFEWEEGAVRVLLRDALEALSQPHPLNTYAGTNALPNGVEGTDDDLLGREKPRMFGGGRNMTPVLVNTSQAIYQYHDGTDVDSLVAVLDSGQILTDDGEESSLVALEAQNPAGGHYSWYEGYIKLGADPFQLTCNAICDDPLAGDVLEKIAGEAGYAVDLGDVSALNALAEVRLYADSSVTTASLIERIATSLGCIWYGDVSGAVRMVPLSAPDSSPSITIRDPEILRISRSATGSGENGLPIWKVVLGMQPIETVQTTFPSTPITGFAATMSARHRWAIASDAAVKTRHPLADEYRPDDSCVRHPADAAAIASTILGLLKVRRDRVTVEAQLSPSVIAALRIGLSIELVSKYFGYSAGRNFLVIGYRIDGRRQRGTLELWG